MKPEVSASAPVLELTSLTVSFRTSQGDVPAVQRLSLQVRAGECLGVVGESGAGKTQAFLTVMGLAPANARVSGRARFLGSDLIGLRGTDLDRLRGDRIAMIFQDAMSTLTPHLTVGDQIAEVLVCHRQLSWGAAKERALELLTQVRVTDPAQRLNQYPYELSGGMRQRVMIAIALACDPALLIADEPTTALDVTIQAQILALLAQLKRERGMSIVLISHDFGVIAGLADAVAVMYAGQCVEYGGVSRVLKKPQHPYTQALLSSLPRIDMPADKPLSAIPGKPPDAM